MHFYPKYSKPLAIILFLIFSLSAEAYHTVNYNAVNGIASNAVHKIFIDKTHRIWLGTDNGVSLMTGNGITNYVYSNGLTHNKIWEIAQCQDSSLWFASFGKGLYELKNERFVNYPLPGYTLQNSIRKLHPFKNLLFVGTEVGLKVFDFKKHGYIHFENISKPDSFQILDFFEYKGELYFQSFYFGTFKINYEKRTYQNVRFNLVENKWNYSAYQYKDTLYLARTHFDAAESDNLLYCKVDDYLKGAPLKSIHLKTIIWEFAHTTPSVMYAACWGVRDDSGGLFKLKGEEMVPVNDEMGIDSKQLMDLCYDKERNKLYIGSMDKGLYIIDLNEIVRKEPYANDQDIIDLKTIHDNTYVLTNNNLILIRHGKVVKKISKSFIADILQKVKPVTDIHPLNLLSPITLRQLSIAQNGIAITSNKGVFRFNDSLDFMDYIFTGYDCSVCFMKDDDALVYGKYNQSALYENFGKGDFIPFNHWLSVHYPVGADQHTKLNDSIYLLSNSGGSLYLYHQKESRYKKFDHLGDAYLPGQLDQVSENKFILIDMSNVIYQGVYKPDTLLLTKKLDLKGFGVRECYFVKSLNGLLVVATNIGIIILDKDKRYLVDKELGLGVNVIFHTAQYQNGCILLASSDGVYSIDINKLRSFKIDYSLSQLFVEVEGKRYSFPTGSRFNLKELPKEFSIHFEMNNHPYSEKINYSYCLNDEKRWHKLLTPGQIRFSDPNYGPTVVYLRIEDNMQGNTMIIKLIDINIKKPVYLQWWFGSLLMVIFASFLFILIYRFRVKHLKTKAANAIKEAKNVQLELDTLQFLLKPHFIFNALTSIQNLILKEENEKSLDYSGYFAKLLRSIMQNSGNDLILLSEELKNIRSYIELEKLRFNEHIQVVINISDEIDIENTQIVPFLFQPLVENIFKHAFKEDHLNPCILISIQRNADLLMYQVVDNGVGLQGNTLDTMLKKPSSKGLKIIVAQLEKFYKSNYSLKLSENPDGGVTWCISTPL